MVTDLLRWFARHGRDLPWRRTSDPYAIWISEVMLQQTQVQTVLPYWERWMTDLPTVGDLAAAPVDRVLKLWEGLGSYHRARNLHPAAQTIDRAHQGQIPTGYHTLLALPGSAALPSTNPLRFSMAMSPASWRACLAFRAGFGPSG
jgi:A/G-specific adenine glycosylase